MKFIARVWALWGLISFTTTFLLFFPFSMIAYLIPGINGQRYFIGLARVWMRIWLFLIACPVKVRGRQHFAGDENYVVVFNHNALLDVPLSAPFVPGANKTIAKDSFAKVPLFGWYYSKGSVLVNRKDEKSRVRSFESMKKVLREGMHMCIYPEGTRNRSGEPLKPFYEGAFRLATETGKDVIPCIITGTRRAMPVHETFYLLPSKLSMTFLEPVSSAGKSSSQLKNEVFEIMKEKYLQLNKPH